MVLNWRSDLSKPALCCNKPGEKEWAAKTPCLREPMFAAVLLVRFPCWLLQRGFFAGRFQMFSPGVSVAVVIWRFWRGKIGRGPGQERMDQADKTRHADARSQPILGEPHRISPCRSWGGSDAVFLWGRGCARVRMPGCRSAGVRRGWAGTASCNARSGRSRH